MKCEVEFTDEFFQWWQTLHDNQQDEVASVVGLLEEHGVGLGFPRSSDVRGSSHGNMRELRIQIEGDSYRIFYTFDPRRIAVLLVGGRKTGGFGWYDRMHIKADRLFEEHLSDVERSEGEV
ncbi:MAG: type II toxin-antitoxin system RelE/ParE family toxin [Bacteroidota bacterium]|jgi:hypothetical protein|nr:type II toxin-antitoxin system RelE/ParE family toxin [Bacteroidota bacterium]